MKNKKPKTDTRETFPQYLLRVGQDYDDTANTAPDATEPYPKGHKSYDESPTARDYRQASARIAELEGLLTRVLGFKQRLAVSDVDGGKYLVADMADALKNKFQHLE